MGNTAQVGNFVARTASTPGSSANLGPGFDSLAVALELRIHVEVRPAERFGVTAEGEGAGIPVTPRHLAARVLRHVLGHDRAVVGIRSEIPVARGLGSSAALAVAVAAAAGAADPLGVAAATDGHPENAAASTYGGLVAATSLTGNEPWAVRLPLDEDAAFVVLVPSKPLSTAKARNVLPAQVAHGDAARNISRAGVLIGALADLSVFRPEAMDDWLHQPYRRTLMPEADALISALKTAGALGAAWSGAGPSILAVCRRGDASRLQVAGTEALASLRIEGDARILRPDMGGLQVAEL